MRQTLALLVLTLALTMVGCGAEGDDGQAPITTVEAPLEIETQGRDQLDEGEEDDADADEDHQGDEDESGKDESGKDKEKKGKALGHDKDDED